MSCDGANATEASAFVPVPVDVYESCEFAESEASFDADDHVVFGDVVDEWEECVAEDLTEPVSVGFSHDDGATFRDFVAELVELFFVEVVDE